MTDTSPHSCPIPVPLLDSVRPLLTWGALSAKAVAVALPPRPLATGLSHFSPSGRSFLPPCSLGGPYPVLSPPGCSARGCGLWLLTLSAPSGLAPPALVPCLLPLHREARRDFLTVGEDKQAGPSDSRNRPPVMPVSSPQTIRQLVTGQGQRKDPHRAQGKPMARSVFPVR